MINVRRLNIRKAGSIFVLLCLFVFILLIHDRSVQAEEKETVKVGYTDYTTFVDEADGNYTGYCVEYLEAISEYTGWEYEFIYDTWENCLDKLERGELDLICMAQYTEERAEQFLYAELPFGYEYSIVYAKSDSDIYYEDYEAMNGCKVGLLEGSFHSEKFFSFTDEMGIEVETEYYEEEEHLVEAVESGAVDMMVVGSLCIQPDMKVIARYGVIPFYCITAKNNTELMEEFDYAMCQIRLLAPETEGKLMEKYYGNNQLSSTPAFTRAEQEYIEASDVVTIKLRSNYRPLSYSDNGELKGIFVNYLERLSEVSGLRFNIELATTSDNGEEQTSLISESEYLTLRPERVLEYEGLDASLIASKALLDTKLAYVVRREDVEITGKRDYVLALTNELSYLEDMILQKSNEYKVVYYSDALQCFDAVVDKEADIAIQDSYLVTYYMQKPEYAEKLAERVGVEFSNGMCIIASKESEILISILNKTISYIPDTEKDAIVSVELVTNAYQQNVGDVLYRYWEVIVISCIMAVISLIIYTLLLSRISNLRIRKKEYEILQKKVQQDELTGVYNRAAFYEKAREMINNATQDMCIIITDISNFKVINDLYGMESGDKLLKFMAEELLRLGEGKEQLVARFTGDHFYMCMKLTDFEEIKFPKRYKTFLEDMDITVTYGVFVVGDQKDIPVNIMCDRANMAAHDKERQRMSYIRYYSEEERKRLIQEQEIVNDMEKAVEERQFCVYIQPKYDIETQTIVGGEALVRWLHPQKGMISPGIFIGVFEKNGFIIRLDYYVWEETCRLISEFKKKGLKRCPISINVSRAHFYGKELQDKLEELIAAYNLEPDDIELEITETICAEDPDIIYKKIKSLQEAGFKVSMDDFGSGYSSLNMLKEMPLDVIKMDLKFLDGGDNEERSRTILRTLISLAQNMNLKVVVEGVETKEQVDFLKEIGNCYAQGYYFSRPVDAAAYESMLEK